MFQRKNESKAKINKEDPEDIVNDEDGVMADDILIQFKHNYEQIISKKEEQTIPKIVSCLTQSNHIPLKSSPKCSKTSFIPTHTLCTHRASHTGKESAPENGMNKWNHESKNPLLAVCIIYLEFIFQANLSFN